MPCAASLASVLSVSAVLRTTGDGGEGAAVSGDGNCAAGSACGRALGVFVCFAFDRVCMCACVFGFGCVCVCVCVCGGRNGTRTRTKPTQKRRK